MIESTYNAIFGTITVLCFCCLLGGMAWLEYLERELDKDIDKFNNQLMRNLEYHG